MSNTNTILTQFFANSEVKQALKISEIKTAKTGLNNGQKKKFEASLTLSKLVENASLWFDKNKSTMNEAGVTLKKEEFFEELFGFQKSFAYKLTRVAKLEQSVVDEFTDKCNAQEREGKPSDRSINALLKFAKGDSGEGDGEGEESAKTLLTLSFKRKDINPEQNNVSVRVDSNGKATTTNTREEIELAIAYLRAAINEEA